MGKTLSQDGFEIENGQIVQSCMPIGVVIKTYEVPLVPTDIPLQTEEAMKFMEIHSRSANDPAERIYVIDQDGVLDPTQEESGRELEPGKAVAYPMRELVGSSGERPLRWVASAAGLRATVTVGK